VKRGEWRKRQGKILTYKENCLKNDGRIRSIPNGFLAALYLVRPETIKSMSGSNEKINFKIHDLIRNYLITEVDNVIRTDLFPDDSQ
jgi:hypothetical protein